MGARPNPACQPLVEPFLLCTATMLYFKNGRRGFVWGFVWGLCVGTSWLCVGGFVATGHGHGHGYWPWPLATGQWDEARIDETKGRGPRSTQGSSCSIVWALCVATL